MGAPVASYSDSERLSVNPLLVFEGLPRFDLITPEQVTPAVDQLLTDCQRVVANLETMTTSPDWANLVVPLDDCTERLHRAWGVVAHLHAVVDTPALRVSYNENLARVTEFWTTLSQNVNLFEKYRQLRHSTAFETLTAAQQRIVDNALRDFRLGGAELSSDKKQAFARVQEKMASVSTRFAENVLDATNAFSLLIEDEAPLAGLPEYAKQAARALAEKEGKAGYMLTLHFPSYYPVMQFADNRDLRETLYRAYVTRASELGTQAEWDNTENILSLLMLRREEADLLGFASFADLSLVPKMAESPAEVRRFLEDLARRARPFAERELDVLRRFSREILGIATLQAWDIPYASEKLREQQYAFSEQELKSYFPEDRVLEGLFRLIQSLFSVTISLDTAPVWHPNVRFYRIERAGQLIGQFYLDLYARPGKRGGAWMDSAISRRRMPQRVQTPLTYLVCNFTEPLSQDGGRQPVFLTHNEVMTLFHEFGHGLHHLLTQMDELGVSGLSGVEWDAVELPSQFMENFCWDWEVLTRMTAQEGSEKPLPRALFEKVLAARNFQSGMQMLRQIEFALVDMRLHSDFDPVGSRRVQDVLDAVRQEFAVVIPPAFNRFLHSFNHIFAGGYPAGYYSYKWAEILSADAYGAFEEAAGDEGLAETGKRFLDEILAVGGSRAMMNSFTAFRGRPPAVDAFLRLNGLTDIPPCSQSSVFALHCTE
ncbi:MAG: M3 family metallopeptidase [Burkholderiaceae bacterium]|jgi:oligopeptidase A|nr:M3 family metallopeptidase [Burkholderiaceae bacterium]